MTMFDVLAQIALPAYAISLPATRLIKKNALLRIIPKLSPAYSVKFDFYPKSVHSAHLKSNVIRLTTGSHASEIGDQIPAVSYRISRKRLEVYSAVNDTGDYRLSTDTVQPGQWTTVEITQKPEGSHYRYTVKVGNIQIGSVINTQRREFTNVKVYASDPQHAAAKGKVKNVVIIPNTQGKSFE